MKKQNERGREEEEGVLWETAWRGLGLTSVLFMPLREQGLSLCPVSLFHAGRGRARRGRGGCFVRQNVLIEKKPRLLSSCSDTIKQLGEGCSQSLIIQLQCTAPFGQWYHETALHRPHRTTLREILLTWRGALKIVLPPLDPAALWALLKATHPIIAVLTQVIASYKEGHQLPVLLKIQSLFLLKQWRFKKKQRLFCCTSHLGKKQQHQWMF